MAVNQKRLKILGCTNHFVMLSFINQLVAASYRLKKSFKYFTVEVLVMEGHLIDFFGKTHV